MQVFVDAKSLPQGLRRSVSQPTKAKIQCLKRDMVCTGLGHRYPAFIAQFFVAAQSEADDGGVGTQRRAQLSGFCPRDVLVLQLQVGGDTACVCCRRILIARMVLI